MVPTWFARVLQMLPGRPKWHIWGLMLIISGVEVASHIFNTYLPIIFLSTLLMTFILIIGMKMDRKEMVDLRDWIVVRALTSALWVTVALWICSDIVAHGFVSWKSYLNLLFIPVLLWFDGRKFLRVMEIVPELPDWHYLKLVKRSDLEGRF